MKKTDKIISGLTIIFLISAIVFGLINYFYYALQIISLLVSIIYYGFLLLHIGLAYPLIAIIMISSDLMKIINVLEVVKVKSGIIHSALCLILHLFILALIYLLPIYIIDELHSIGLNGGADLDALINRLLGKS